MTERGFPSNQQESQRLPAVKSNWWRLTLYFIFFAIGAITCTFPLLLFFPQLIEDYESIQYDASYLLSSQAALAVGVLGATHFMAKEIEYKQFSSYRLNIDLKLLGSGFLLGAAIMAFIAIALQALELVDFQYKEISPMVTANFLIYMLVAVIEEVIFRGYVLTNMNEKLTAFWAAALSSLLFGLAHVGNDHFTWFDFASIALSGYLMAVLSLKSGSISPAVGLHWSWNFVQGPILGFAVSGHAEKGIFQANSIAADVLTGGKFGAEGSILVMLFALTLAVCFSFKAFYLDQKKSNDTSR
ncbi:MAG: CPBP family intramembrane glutamic endopeptidase [Cytophagales bacterium]